jgi:hypothetical protein
VPQHLGERLQPPDVAVVVGAEDVDEPVEPPRELPPDVGGVGGDNEMMVESFGYMAEALVLAIIFVYLILAAQFESFIDPLSIMLSLPLSIVGMAGTLALTGDTINIMSLIGLIMLMGLVTKNAILLVDYTKVLRGRGLDRVQACIEAGRTRLRPIVMTKNQWFAVSASTMRFSTSPTPRCRAVWKPNVSTCAGRSRSLSIVFGTWATRMRPAAFSSSFIAE